MKPTLENMKTFITFHALAAAVTLCAAWPATSQETAQTVPRQRAIQAATDSTSAVELRKLRDLYALRESYSSSSSSRELVQPLVIQFSPGTSNSLEQTVEDLTVMTRLIEKALDGGLGEEEPTVKVGVRILLTGGSRSVRAMYVEGLGPLFMIKVNFPLVAPANEEPPPPPAARSEWDKARAEVKGIDLAREDAWAVIGSSRAEYNQELVEALTQTLLAALKQATHIRELKPDDHIAVSVFGPAPRSGSGTVLTLRAKKSDVDAFAKGDLDLPAFRRLTSLSAYAGPGHDLASVNSWIQESRPVSRNAAPAVSSTPRSSSIPSSGR